MAKLPEEAQRERQFLKRKIKALAAEYHSKVTYDFSRYIYVGAKENFHLLLEQAIHLITTCAGYQAHRVVVYKNHIATSIYVRFADQSYAADASERILQQDGYCVDNVSAMLLSWYLEEMLKGNFPWTLALVRIEGRPEHPNPLSEDALQGMLMQFGDPRINTYQRGNQIEHVQVLFSSMAEALGASIAHGRWFVGNVRENLGYYYIIQIMSSEKEATLLRAIQPTKLEPDQEIEAFEMDYFVQNLGVRAASYCEDDSYLPNSIQPSTSRDFRNSGGREFRRQLSKSRGNDGRPRSGNPRSAYENRNYRRISYNPNRILPQEFVNHDDGVNL